MKQTLINNSTKINCISPREAQMLHEHIKGYFNDKIQLNQDDVVLDIGANIGVYGVELSKRYKDITIFAFEPINDIYSVLKANSILSENKNFNVYKYGLSDKNEVVEFTYYPNSPALSNSNPNIWKSKRDLIPALSGNLKHAPSNWWWAKFIPSLFYPLIINNLVRNARNTKCELKRLSDFIIENNLENISLVKIDCEGNELKVINGINEEHWSIIDQLIIEVHDIDNRLNYIKNMLSEKSYEVEIFKEPSLEKTNLYNLIAVKG